MVSAAVASLKLGEEENELSEFYEENRNRLYALAFSRLHSRESAEDVLQEAFLRIVKYPEKFFQMEIRKRLPYLIIIINHLVADILAEGNNFSDDELPEDIECQTLSVEENAIGNIAESELLGFINKMPESKRCVIELKIIYDMTPTEIAEALGITEATARKRLSVAQKMIKDFLKGGTDDE